MTGEGNPATHVDEIFDESIGESIWLGGVRMVVSPAAGRFRHLPPVDLHDGVEWVTPGQAIAVVEQAGTVAEIRSPIEARVTGFMVRAGEPVMVGQPVVWLEHATRGEGSHRGRRRA
jgi:biotin carboxyl carrier protein